MWGWHCRRVARGVHAFCPPVRHDVISTQSNDTLISHKLPSVGSVHGLALTTSRVGSVPTGLSAPLEAPPPLLEAQAHPP